MTLHTSPIGHQTVAVLYSSDTVGDCTLDLVQLR